MQQESRFIFCCRYQCFILSYFPQIRTHAGQLEVDQGHVPSRWLCRCHSSNVPSTQQCPCFQQQLFQFRVISIASEPASCAPREKLSSRYPFREFWVPTLLLGASRFLINHDPFLSDCYALAVAAASHMLSVTQLCSLCHCGPLGVVYHTAYTRCSLWRRRVRFLLSSLESD